MVKSLRSLEWAGAQDNPTVCLPINHSARVCLRCHLTVAQMRGRWVPGLEPPLLSVQGDHPSSPRRVDPGQCLKLVEGISYGIGP
jgi:hypothetical protein